MSYVAVAIEGGLFPADLLERAAAGDLPGQRPQDFGLGQGERLSDAIQAAFSDARAYWDAFQRRLAHSSESRTTLTREAWVIPLLKLLGFDRVQYQRASLQVGEDPFPISHLAGDSPTAPPVHIVAVDQPIDRRGEGKRSPHALVQEYLNRSDSVWGLVTNGERLRVLRDATRVSRPVYLEFDLRAIVEGNRYSEFVLLYRLVHRTRWPASAEDVAECWLERYYQQGIEEGSRVRERLREGVEAALRVLGTAFLAHPANGDLRHTAASNLGFAADYYRQLLRLVYRLLFLFVAEERRLLAVPDPALAARQEIYHRHYSLSRLRRLAERPIAADGHDDLWEGLRQVFRLFRDPHAASLLGLTALDGELFELAGCRDLESARCANASLLAAIQALSTFRVEAGTRRVNYAALDVEELGSVYESLLEYHPHITLDPPAFALAYGSQRKETGSYYTPPELVRELVGSALAPVVQERLARARRLASSEWNDLPDEMKRLFREHWERRPRAGASAAGRLGVQPGDDALADAWRETPIDERRALLAEHALLGVRVLDPASGSGHFLLAAARYLGRELARIRTGEPEPSPEEYRRAVRQVIRRCLYAVDKNPLAVDLCKVALWIEGHAPGLPLSFLDHHVKCGDSLVGVFDLDVLAEGIPDRAYNREEKEEKQHSAWYRTLNRQARKGQLGLWGQAGQESPLEQLTGEFAALAESEEGSPADVQAKAALYQELRGRGTAWERWKVACDLWTAAWFVELPDPDSPDPLERGRAAEVPVTAHLREWLTGGPPSRAVWKAKELAEGLQFFHWPLEFPEVFERGGFDVVLGNPPWEQLQPEEVKFFSSVGATRIAQLSGEERKRAIQALDRTDPSLAAAWKRHQRTIHQMANFARSSGRFPKSGTGKINTYAVFAELAWRLLGPRGRAGVVVPTGIATDDTTKHLFGALVDARALVSLFDFENRQFENRQRLFPAVDSRTKFCLLTLAAGGRPEPAEFAFFVQRAEELRDPERRLTLTAEDFARINPNTRTCPVFRTRRDAELTRAVYARLPVLVREGVEDGNPWGVTLHQGLFHMTSDSYLFHTRQQLEAAGYRLVGNVFVPGGALIPSPSPARRGEDRAGQREADSPLLPPGEGGRGDEGLIRYLPLYEAKLAHQFDHRWASYGGPGRIGGGPEPGGPPLLVRRPRKGEDAVELAREAKGDPELVVLPRYWVPEAEVEARLAAKGWRRGWLLGWRDICRSTDQRTVIATVLPRVGVGDTFLLMFPEGAGADAALCLVANLCSFPLDYVARQKVSGTHLTYHVFTQLPVLPPQAYERPCPWHPSLTLAEWIWSRALELVYTAWDLAPFARDLGYHGPPFRWDEERRFLLRCELDAAYFHLYGLAREEVAYVLGTFPLVEESDRKRYGEYRTARLVLEVYDALASAQRSGFAYRTPLDPPPADPRAAHPRALPVAENAAGASD